MVYFPDWREKRWLLREIRGRLYRLQNFDFQNYTDGLKAGDEVWDLIDQARRFNSRRDRRISPIDVTFLSSRCFLYSDNIEYAAIRGLVPGRESFQPVSFDLGNGDRIAAAQSDY